MLRAHRQAWCWQDEYHGLTIDDIRRLERETQLALQEKMTSSEASSTQPTADGRPLAAGTYCFPVLPLRAPYGLCGNNVP